MANMDDKYPELMYIDSLGSACSQLRDGEFCNDKKFDLKTMDDKAKIRFVIVEALYQMEKTIKTLSQIADKSKDEKETDLRIIRLELADKAMYWIKKLN